MCVLKPWPEALSITLLGLRAAYKEDLQASSAEMLYGITLRLPEEFFVTADYGGSPQIFVEKHCELMRGLRPTPMAHHVKSKMFVSKDLHTCSHVFIRCDHVKAPLEPPIENHSKSRKESATYLSKLTSMEYQKHRSLETCLRRKIRYSRSDRTHSSPSSS
ncbi:uncharacterized protein [Venturia canescens]|uniref:uncharacterized protein n=1 Tax=Venturia canescens TaxID=32260 RepID=UPI001C9BD39F|nr:uncharacterized protein LOC122410831 [Venturia canescens]